MKTTYKFNNFKTLIKSFLNIIILLYDYFIFKLQMSSLSSNDNTDSMARATYYAQQQLLAQQHHQQLQYQQAQLQMQYQQQKQLLNKNQHNSMSNASQHNYNINNTYSAASCVNNYSSIANNNYPQSQHMNSHNNSNNNNNNSSGNVNNLPATLAHHPTGNHQQYQHPSLSTVFPSIYAEANFNKNNSNGSGNNSEWLFIGV